MSHSILTLISKGTSIFYVLVLVLWHYIKRNFFFLKEKNEAFNWKRIPGEYLKPREKQNIYIAVFIFDTAVLINRLSHLKIMQNKLSKCLSINHQGILETWIKIPLLPVTDCFMLDMSVNLSLLPLLPY